MRPALALTLALLLAARTAAADTYYLVDLTKHAFMISASSIRDIGPGLRASEVHEVGFLETQISKVEVNCAQREMRILGRATYWLQSEMLKPKGTAEGTDWLPLQHHPEIERIYSFVCSWPTVDKDMENAEFADDLAMVTSLSESILDMPAR
jgi:hypothetical protein